MEKSIQFNVNGDTYTFKLKQKRLEAQVRGEHISYGVEITTAPPRIKGLKTEFMAGPQQAKGTDTRYILLKAEKDNKLWCFALFPDDLLSPKDTLWVFVVKSKED